MAEVIQQPVTPSSGPKPLSARSKTNLVIVVAVIVAVAIGAVFYKNHQDNQNKKTQPYSKQYSSLSHYYLQGKQTGSGVKFSMPTAFGASGSSKSGQLSAQFAEIKQISDHNIPKGVNMGNLSVSSVYSSSPPTPNYIKQIGEIINNPSDKHYQSAVQSIQNYVKNNLSAYNLKFANAKPFTSSTIKTNAWSFGFTGAAKQGFPVDIYPSLQGEAVLAIGKTTFYYYYEDAVAYNWTDPANQSVWQQTLNSINIDQ